jgi:hypothetical protein
MLRGNHWHVDPAVVMAAEFVVCRMLQLVHGVYGLVIKCVQEIWCRQRASRGPTAAALVAALWLLNAGKNTFLIMA